MNLLNVTILTGIGVPVYDWLAVTGSAAKATSFDYVYWPPTRLRWISIFALAVGTLVTFSLVHPPEIDDSGLWRMLPFFCGVVFHCVIFIRDFFLQRRAAPSEASDG